MQPATVIEAVQRDALDSKGGLFGEPDASALTGSEPSSIVVKTVVKPPIVGIASWHFAWWS